MANKYYWLKLKKDFFKRHDIRVIEAMPNGKDYILFYLKLLVESVDHEGSLRFSDTIPYNDQMLSTITDTNIDIVRSAMKVFTELNMIDVLDDQTIHMLEVEKMLGSETDWAVKKREYKNRLADNVRTISEQSPTVFRQEIEKEIEKEIEIDKEIDTPPIIPRGDSQQEQDAKVFVTYETEIHPPSAIEMERIADWIDSTSPDCVILAIREAVGANALNMNYINSIITSWVKQGVKTKAAAEAKIREFKERTTRGHPPQSKPQYKQTAAHYENQRTGDYSDIYVPLDE